MSETITGILGLIAIAGAIYVGYYYRTKKECSMKKSVGMGCLGYFILTFIAGMVGYATMTDQEKAEMEAEQVRKDSIEAVQKAKERAQEISEDKKFRAYAAARAYLINHLRDPDSYKEDNYNCTSDAEEQIYTVNIRYRARNGFGGMNLTITSFKVLVNDKEALVISTENL